MYSYHLFYMHASMPKHGKWTSRREESCLSRRNGLRLGALMGRLCLLGELHPFLALPGLTMVMAPATVSIPHPYDTCHCLFDTIIITPLQLHLVFLKACLEDFIISKGLRLQLLLQICNAS